MENLRFCDGPDYLCRVADIAPAGMEAHDNLNLQAQGLYEVK